MLDSSLLYNRVGSNNHSSSFPVSAKLRSSGKFLLANKLHQLEPMLPHKPWLHYLPRLHYLPNPIVPVLRCGVTEVQEWLSDQQHHHLYQP